MFRVAKLPAWYILRKKEHTVELGNSKRTIAAAGEDGRIFSTVKENLFRTSTQVKSALRKVGGSVSTSDYHEEKTSCEGTQGENHQSASKIESPDQTL